MPTITSTDDFSHGNFAVPGGADYDLIGGSPAKDTTVRHASDPASLLISTAAAAEYVRHTVAGTPTLLWHGYWMYIAAADEPGSDVYISTIQASGTNDGVVAYVPATNRIYHGLGANTESLGDDTFALSTWYWMEHIMDISSTTRAIYSRQNGVALPPATNADSAQSGGRFLLGTTQAHTMTVRYSDHYYGYAASIDDWHGAPLGPGFRRFFGPALLPASSSTLFTTSPRSRDRIHQIRLVNNDEDNAVAVELALGGAYAQEVLADAPRAYYRMDEASGLPQDSSGNDNHATASFSSSVLYDETGATTSDPSSTSIKAVPLDFRAPDHATLDLGDVFTLECWAKRTRSGVQEFLVCKGIGAYALCFQPEDVLLLTEFATASNLWSTVTITDTDWHHLVATKSGATMEVYVDGVACGDHGAETNSTFGNTTVALTLGSDGPDGTGTPRLEGWLDEVAIYPTALTADRVRAHYDAATVQTFFSDTLSAGESRSVRGPFTLEAGEIVQGATPFPQTPILDDFNRADGAAGANWTGLIWGCGFSWSINGNTFLANGTFTGCGWAPAQFGDDCEVYCTLAVDPAPGNSVYLGLRMTTLDASPNGYRVGIATSTGVWTLQRVTGGGTTNIGTRNQVVSVGDSMGLAAIGTNLQLWYKSAAGSWTQLGADVEDATYVQTGYIGVLGPDGATKIDDFGGGSTGGPVTATIVGIRESL